MSRRAVRQHTRKPTELQHLRRHIGARVRDLRQDRRWSQAELAKHLGLSQNRLSEIERGAGSFTAEQFVEILRRFNVSVTHFVEPVERDQLVQNALARFGASHLLETTEAVGPERLDDVHAVVCEALVEGGPRLVTATAPVLVRHAKTLSLQRIYRMLFELGREARLAWVADNTVHALETLQSSARSHRKLFREAQVGLTLFVDFASQTRHREPDVLDTSVRSAQTLAAIEKQRSSISKRWNILSRLQPEDFVSALEAAFGGD